MTYKERLPVAVFAAGEAPPSAPRTLGVNVDDDLALPVADARPGLRLVLEFG
jgi:hypothetical protein